MAATHQAWVLLFLQAQQPYQGLAFLMHGPQGGPAPVGLPAGRGLAGPFGACLPLQLAHNHSTTSFAATTGSASLPEQAVDKVKALVQWGGRFTRGPSGADYINGELWEQEPEKWAHWH